MNQMQQARDTINYLLDLLETCGNYFANLRVGPDTRTVALKEIIHAERRKLDRTFTVARNLSTTTNHQRRAAMSIERFDVTHEHNIASDPKGDLCYYEDVAELEAKYAELLEAAERVVKRWDSPQWKDQQHIAVFIDQLRAAIAKAKGEQP